MNFSNLRTKAAAGLTAMLVALFFATAAFTQSGTSGVSGTVADQNGAVVPGATVTLTTTTTGLSRSTVTNDAGRYAFSSIAPSTYKLEITASGFKKAVNNEIQALVDSPVEFNVVLETGDVSVVVDVTAGTIESVINTTDATIGNNFVPEQIINLPTDLRNFNNLLALQPGVTRDGYVAGGRSDQANITLDGVDINDQQTGGRSGSMDIEQTSALRSTVESIQEFRITTLGANANQGRSSGAQVSLITKSGTNDFRGAAYYFYRPTNFSANNFFNNLAGVERPSLARSVYGGAIGGPIKKDKLFFFYTYEGQYQVEDASVNRLVPLAHLGAGEIRFSGTLPGETPCPPINPPPGCTPAHPIAISLAELNSIYSAAGINPDALAVLSGAASRYSSNNTIIGDGTNTGGFLFNSPTIDRDNTHIARFDYNATSKHQLFVRGNYQSDTLANTSAFPDTTSTSLWEHPWGVAAGHTWTISNNIINNFRYGFTRQAFSQQGDSSDNNISFRFVYSPLLFQRTLDRVTPVTNITDDLTWIKGNHTLQFGGNVRIIRNTRNTFASAFDSAVTNPSFYELSGAVVDQQIRDAGYSISGGSIATVQAAATALIGRFSQYSGNFTYDIDGNVLPVGTASARTFATEEYDSYIQDIWKAHRTLTLTFGVRYAVSRPVYEKNGFQIVPSVRLGDFFERRKTSAAIGIPTNDSIQFQLGGPANDDAPGFYSMDWNNVQPRFAAAWTPNIGGKVGRFLFGNEGDSVIRGGIGIANDYFGGQLAVSFDGLSSIGFTSDTTIAANTYNVTDNLAPRFTGFDLDIRTLPGIPQNPPLRFNTPADGAQRIESSLDSTIVSPTHYSWNASYGRSLPKGMYFEASYIGRSARNLFGSRDIMALNNLVDPQTGMDWYTAAGMLHDLRAANTDIDNIQPIAYFENLFPNFGANFWGFPAWNSTQGIYTLIAREDFTIGTGICDPDPGCEFFNVLDWTFIQSVLDDEGIHENAFFHPQYAAFSAFGTFAKSNYHGGSLSLRQRLGETLSYDINYTFSKSMDDASGLQTDGSFAQQFLLNPLRPEDNYSVSDFDTKHVVNANFLFNLPIGRGRAIGGDMNRFADALIGGWALRGIYRWNSGQPISTPFDQGQWATNWNAQSNTTRIRQVDASTVRSTQNLFADPQAAFQSFRNARPGETGERNTMRLPGFQTLDLGLSKSFKMPWSEGHKFDVRWEVFNVTNIQYFLANNATRSSYGIPIDPETGEAPSDFGQIFTNIQGNPRRMQFGFRYSF